MRGSGCGGHLEGRQRTSRLRCTQAKHLACRRGIEGLALYRMVLPAVACARHRLGGFPPLDPATHAMSSSIHQSTEARAKPVRRAAVFAAALCLLMPWHLSQAKGTGIIVWPAMRGGAIVGGPYDGSVLPGKGGGMVVGGPLDGSVWPGAKGGMIVGGPLAGTVWPKAAGGMIIGGPLAGTIWPPASGGMVVGGPLDGYLIVTSRGK